MLGGIGLVWHAEKNPSNLNDLQIPLFFTNFAGGGEDRAFFFGGHPILSQTLWLVAGENVLGFI